MNDTRIMRLYLEKELALVNSEREREEIIRRYQKTIREMYKDQRKCRDTRKRKH